MEPILATTFLDVIWWMLIVFFWTMIIWMFIAVFADVFRRDDLSGWAKAGWSLAFIFLPLLGILIYIIVRPKEMPVDTWPSGSSGQVAGGSATEDIAKAQQLLQSGAINQEEFDQLKRKALA